MNRRNFIKQIGVGTAGLSMLKWIDLAALTFAETNISLSMGGLTNFMLIDDCARLAIAGGNVSEKVKNYIDADITKAIPANISRMGAMVSADLKEVVDEFADAESNITKAKSELENLPDDANNKKREELQNNVIASERRFAILLGWFMSSGIREYIFPIYHEEGLNNLEIPGEMKIYQDMHVLRDRAMISDQANEKDVALLFNGMLPRMICRTHTMTPDYNDGFDWTVRISGWREKNVELMNQFAEAFIDPDERKIKKYITDTKFYDSADNLITAAKESHNGKDIDPSAVQNMLSKEDAKSLYAKALKAGIESIQFASEFVVGSINKEKLVQKLSG